MHRKPIYSKDCVYMRQVSNSPCRELSRLAGIMLEWPLNSGETNYFNQNLQVPNLAYVSVFIDYKIVFKLYIMLFQNLSFVIRLSKHCK